ncbi:MAG: pseudouridine synthase [Rhodospirillales bacterium]|nr:pseudouridine synthase [Rhodospirillales bacterium]
MRLVKLIANLGYGSQKEVRAMVRGGRVTSRTGTLFTPDSHAEHGDVLVDGQPLDPAAGVVLMMNKPVDYTCATSDPGRVVYELLPERFIRRNPVIAPAGRLDRDASGLLLLTDDGPLLHRIMSPRGLVPKVYEVRLARPLAGTEAEIFAGGALMLRSETTPLAPAVLEVLGERQARLTITEGRYHQVRRMFAAVGNHVEALHRSAVGGLSLDGLDSGQWREMSGDEVARIFENT